MDEHEMMRRWVETWKQAGPELEAIQREEIANADNAADLAALAWALKYRLAFI